MSKILLAIPCLYGHDHTKEAIDSVIDKVDALPFIAIKIRNIGLVNQSGENISNTDRANTSYLRQELKDKGDFYLKRLQEYLCEYDNLFPAYTLGTRDDLIPNYDAPSPNCDIAFDKSIDIDTAFYRKYIRGG